MVNQLIRFIEEKELIAAGEQTLLALSGGLDSTVMSHLFQRAGFPFAVAHCNFRLRGADADADEQFVKELAAGFGVPFYRAGFDTQEFAEGHKISIQEAARELRYDWFKSLARQEGFPKIATAHHLGDSVETMLLNLVKGCGLRGLHGIRPVSGQLIRPLLFTHRRDLERWATDQKITWREDASNASLKYERNRMRNAVIPELEALNPAFLQSATATIERLRDAELIYDLFLEQFRKEAVVKTGHGITLRKEALRFGAANRTLLYELLVPYGFNNRQSEQILAGFERQSGAVFYSLRHRLLINRDGLEILPIAEGDTNAELLVGQTTAAVPVTEGKFEFEWLDEPPHPLPADQHIAILDAKGFHFPLKLRRWRPGDVFQPLGMGGKHQKLQDLFNNLKLSRFDKERVWILESRGEICWIANHRMDERFKVKLETKRCLLVRFTPDNFTGV